MSRVDGFPVPERAPRRTAAIAVMLVAVALTAIYPSSADDGSLALPSATGSYAFACPPVPQISGTVNGTDVFVYPGPPVEVTVDPSGHRLAVAQEAAVSASSSEQCSADGLDFVDHLAVDAGGTDLPLGSPVWVRMTAVMTSSVDETYSHENGDFSTDGFFLARASLVERSAPATCPPQEGVQNDCGDRATFEARAQRKVYAGSPAPEVEADWAWAVSTIHEGEVIAEDRGGSATEPSATAPTAPLTKPSGTYVVEMATEVGAVLELSGYVTALSTVYNGPVSSNVAADLGVGVSGGAGFEGLHIRSSHSGTTTSTTTPSSTTSTTAPPTTTTTVPSPPEIDRLEPDRGPDVGGTRVRVLGDELDQGIVHLDGAALPTDACQGDRGELALCFTTPPRLVSKDSASIASVTVRTPNGRTSNPAGFSYFQTPAPEIDRLDPDRGPDVGGTRVRVLGKNLDQGIVHLDGAALPTDACRGDRGELALCFTTPPRVLSKEGKGTAWVTVGTANGKRSHAAEFTYSPAPTPAIRGLDPNRGPDTGGTRVRVLGRNLDQGTVHVDGVAVATEVCLGDRGELALCFTSPPRNLGKARDGVALISVSTPNGKASNASRFTYRAS